MKVCAMASNWTLPLILFVAAAIPTVRARDEAAPAAMLRAAITETLAVAYPGNGSPAPDTIAAKVRPILDRAMDLESITRRAIGPGWRQFTAAERERAVELFTVLMVRTYVGRLTGGSMPKIEYKPTVAVASERWEVPTQISRDASSYEVIFRIETRPDGLRIYDIVAEGVSFVANYRAQFDALFQKGGVGAVLRALETKQPASAGQ